MKWGGRIVLADPNCGKLDNSKLEINRLDVYLEQTKKFDFNSSKKKIKASKQKIYSHRNFENFIIQLRFSYHIFQQRWAF